jgi:hypothetical protein
MTVGCSNVLLGGAPSKVEKGKNKENKRKKKKGNKRKEKILQYAKRSKKTVLPLRGLFTRDINIYIFIYVDRHIDIYIINIYMCMCRDLNI